MKNNASFFYLDGLVSKQSEKVYPEEVFPFLHAGVAMFSHEEHPSSWAVTECSTGCCVGRGEDQEKAEVQAREIINQHIEIKEIIGYVFDMLEADFEYDTELSQWDPLEPIEEDNA